MANESVSKLYEHFKRTADANKYHGNLTVLKTFLRLPESDIRQAITTIEEQFHIRIFWFSDNDFIADITFRQLQDGDY